MKTFHVELGTLRVFMLPGGMDNYICVMTRAGDPVAAVVDPFDAAPVISLLEDEGLAVSTILATHHHGDHTAGIPKLKKHTGAMVVGPRGSGIEGVDREVADGDELDAGPLHLGVLATPGHTRTDITYYSEADRAIWCGDTMFSGGCGRLFECDAETLYRSLMKLAALPPETSVFCGHEYTESNLRFALSVDGEDEALRDRANEVGALRSAGRPTLPTTIGEERKSNLFLRCGEVSLRTRLGMTDAGDSEVFAELRGRKDRF